MELTVTQLKKQLKEKQLHSLYLFYGEETYLCEQYARQVCSLAVDPTFAEFNFCAFDEDHQDFDQFVAALESYPQMAEHKVIMLKQTDFLKSAEYQKAMAAILKDIPPYAVVLFVEREKTKLKKDLVKAIAAGGVVTEFKKQMASDLRAWVNHRFAAAGKKMKVADMEYLVELCGRSLSNLESECGKLIAYAGENEVISRDAIDQMVAVPTEYKIFTMADHLLDHKPQMAYNLLQELKQNREQPTVIIGLIYTQLSALLMFRSLQGERVKGEDFLPANRKFLARRYQAACAKHSPQKLRSAMRLCAQFDQRTKTGQIDGYTALELLMAELLIH